MKLLIDIIIVAVLVSIATVFFTHKESPKPDPPPTKLKPIKVIDANKQVSYISWECVTNE